MGVCLALEHVCDECLFGLGIAEQLFMYLYVCLFCVLLGIPTRHRMLSLTAIIYSQHTQKGLNYAHVCLCLMSLAVHYRSFSLGVAIWVYSTTSIEFVILVFMSYKPFIPYFSTSTRRTIGMAPLRSYNHSLTEYLLSFCL